MPTKGTNFRVEFAGVKLPTPVAKRIAAAIEKAVLSELASVDLKGDLQVGRFRKEWLGIWLRTGRFQGGPAGPGR